MLLRWICHSQSVCECGLRNKQACANDSFTSHPVSQFLTIETQCNYWMSPSSVNALSWCSGWKTLYICLFLSLSLQPSYIFLLPLPSSFLCPHIKFHLMLWFPCNLMTLYFLSLRRWVPEIIILFSLVFCFVCFVFCFGFSLVIWDRVSL